ncbi:hypothetical protein E4K67_06995 [Desulfosporosinus fructosivorans]|uniref:Uncharacterized protein n=1 Tax=Desulfosporosinus fructosivorans TaxID=2018669 RepID=A0A4Z0RA69_9FIRM|nr:hypothetical protein [Desulfosporosinus fructosivorans]TGE39199.1 hypothetical protein E4K67_06995 [Desulfosporosinus fructosivorans]
MRKTGIILLALLMIFSVTGCSGQKPSKTQTERSPFAPQTISTSQNVGRSKSTSDQSTVNKNPVSQAVTSKQLTETDSMLQGLNDVLKSLDDVSSEELIIPNP